MKCAFYGSLYKQVLIDSTYAAQNTQMNLVVYSQLEVSTIGGAAHHLIKQYEDDKNGYGVCNALCEWYDGDAVKEKTADSLRSKLESYRLTSASNTEQ